MSRNMVKEKPKCQRSYDLDGYRKRAACVCVKNENENEVLLISSSKNKQYWVIPGGGIEENENPEDAAEREVYEEAGVQGRLGRLLGIFEVFENKERKHRTNVYLLVVDKEFEDWEENRNFGRVRRWFNLDEAKDELRKYKPVQGSYLNLLKGFQAAISSASGLLSSSTSLSGIDFTSFGSTSNQQQSERHQQQQPANYLPFSSTNLSYSPSSSTATTNSLSSSLDASPTSLLSGGGQQQQQQQQNSNRAAQSFNSSNLSVNGFLR